MNLAIRLNSIDSLSVPQQVMLAFAMAVPYMFVILTSIHSPGTDEAFQLEAATRLINGNGYTASLRIPADLSVPAFDYLLAWPIGYALIIGVLAKLGMPIELAAKALKIFAIGGALIAWIVLANRHLRYWVTQSLFSGLLGFYVITCAWSPCDLLLILLFPLISMLMLQYSEDSNPRQPSLLMLAGILSGSAFSIKYSAIPLTAMGAIWILWLRRKDPAECIKNLGCFLLPATTIIGTILFANHLQAMSVGPLINSHEASSPWAFRLSWLGDALSGLFFEAPYLTRILVRALLGDAPEAYQVLAKFMVIFVLMTTVLISLVTLLRHEMSGRRLATWASIAYLSAILFLGLTTALYFSKSTWTPLGEGRYYEWIVPIIGICVLAAFQEHVADTRQSRIRMLVAITVAGTLALTAAASVGYSIYQYRVMRDLGADTKAAYELISTIHLEDKAASLVVFLDARNFPAFPWRGDINAFTDPVALLTRPHFSQKTLVVMICTRSEPRITNQNENHCKAEGFEGIAQSLGFSKGEIGPRTIIYSKVFGPALTR